MSNRIELKDGYGYPLVDAYYYEGERKYRKPHGRGIQYRLDDDTRYYEGEWWNGKEYGKGTVYWYDGITKRYEGEWKEGELHGKGIEYRSDGTKLYEGEWKEGEFYGKGIQYWDDGITKRYEGEWKEGKRHGNGTLYCPADIKEYEGEWKEGRQHGNGTEYGCLGQKFYEGEFKDGIHHGRGMGYNWFGDKEYEGEWKEGKRHGKGIEYNLDGTKRYEGKWKNDKKVASMKMEKIEDIQYEGLGFPTSLKRVKHVKFKGELHPKIDVKAVSDKVILELASLKRRFTGNEVRFIRSYFSMSLRDFAEHVVHESHTAVAKWEKQGNKPTNMNKNTEQVLRLYIFEETSSNEEMEKDVFYNHYKASQSFLTND